MTNPAQTHSGVRQTVRHRLSAAVAVLAAAVLTLVGPAPIASAHTSLESSNPAADSTVDAPPTSVQLVFVEPVRSPDPKVAITIAGYDPVEISATIVGSTVSADLTGVDIPGLSAAPYPVGWTLGYRLVALDGDPFSGSVKFTVSAGPPVTSAETIPTETTPTETTPTETTLTETTPTETAPAVTTPAVTTSETPASTSTVATTSASPTGSSTGVSTFEVGTEPTSPPVTSAAAPATAANSTGDSGSSIGWIIVGIVVVAALVAVGLVLRRRRAAQQ